MIVNLRPDPLTAVGCLSHPAAKGHQMLEAEDQQGCVEIQPGMGFVLLLQIGIEDGEQGGLKDSAHARFGI